MFLTSILFESVIYHENSYRPGGSPSPIYFSGSNITIIDSTFSNPSATCSGSELGGFIVDVTENTLSVFNSEFRDVCAQDGGSIYMAGVSDVKIHNSRFTNLTSIHSGSAIHAKGFSNFEIKGS